MTRRSDLDGAFGGGEALVAGQEGEAFGLLTEQTGGEVAVADTDLTVVGDGTVDAERLQAFTDGFCSIGSGLAAFLDGDSSTAGVGPLHVLEADGLGFFSHRVRVDALGFANLVGFLNAVDAVLVQNFQDIGHAAFLTFKFHFSSCHGMSSLYKFVTDNFVVFVQGEAGAVAFSHLKVTGTLFEGAEHGADLAAQTFAEVFQRSTNQQAAF